MKKAGLKKFLSLALAAYLLVPALTPLANTNTTTAADFGAGKGIAWPNQVNAPFVDMVQWVSKADYNISGVANLGKLSQDTGVKFFNLGFIQSCGTVTDNMIDWGWGGYSILSEKKGSGDTQYQGIKKSINSIRDLGGDVTISFGGLNGTPFWETSQDVNVLTNTYLDIIKGYGLTRIDLDIEGGAQDKTKNIINAQAIKKVQAETGVQVVLTLPVLPSGLTQVQLDVLEAYLSNGVDVSVVNVMAMCYGSSTLNPGENYGTASLRAVDSTALQVKDYFKKFANIDLTLEQAYAKVGTTTSVGFEGSGHPVFTTDWTKLVVDHAIKNKIAMVSFWSMNRDAQLQTNSGINAPYEHTNICKTFGKDPIVDPNKNTPPVLKGVSDKTIKVGTEFNPLTGITAEDKEDGDLTTSIKVTGTVDTKKAGKYTLTYSVTDSKKETVTATAIITVVSEDIDIPSEKDTYDATKTYLAGDKVIYKGIEYTAKWYTIGNTPGTDPVWEKAKTTNPDGYIEYNASDIYNTGDLVLYQGKVYKALWWTTSTPGSDTSWQFVK